MAGEARLEVKILMEEDEHPNADNVDKVYNRLENLIQVVRDSGELSYTELIGVLTVTMLDLHREISCDCVELQDDDEEDI